MMSVARAAGSRTQRFLIGVTVATGLLAGVRPAPPRPPAPSFPWQRVHLDRAQVAALDHGDAVTKLLDTRNDRDIAVFGIIRLGVSRAAYLARALDFPTFLRQPTRPRFGIFHTPVVAADVEAVTVDREDVTDVKNCRIGNCKLKLPSTEMLKIQGQLDWSPTADPRGQLNAYLRRRLMEYVTDYRARGDSAMVTYDDVGSVHASSAFAALLGQVRDIYEDIPSLRQFFTSYPRTVLDSPHEVVFWAQDSEPGLKRILTLTHILAYSPPEYPGVSLLAAKQIYASHFFEGALELTAIVDHPDSSGAPGIYLVILRLSRFDDLPSGLIFSVRNKVADKLRDQLRGDLERQLALTGRTSGPL